MSGCPTFTFQVSIMSKWLAIHISTKVSFEITIRKTHVYTGIRWPWKRNQYFYLGIWDELSKIIFFAFFSARYTIKFTEQKWNKFINELWLINLYMNISISNWHNWSFDSTKMKFFTLFQFLTRLMTSTTLISLVHNSLGETEWCEKSAFQLLKMRKMKVSWNIKTKCVTDFLLTVRSSVSRIILLITRWAHKSQTFALISLKLLWILKFFVYT